LDISPSDNDEGDDDNQLKNGKSNAHRQELVSIEASTSTLLPFSCITFIPTLALT
jgi:hypothetical protein